MADRSFSRFSTLPSKTKPSGVIDPLDDIVMGLNMTRRELGETDNSGSPVSPPNARTKRQPTYSPFGGIFEDRDVNTGLRGLQAQPLPMREKPEPTRSLDTPESKTAFSTSLPHMAQESGGPRGYGDFLKAKSLTPLQKEAAEPLLAINDILEDKDTSKGDKDQARTLLELGLGMMASKEPSAAVAFATSALNALHGRDERAAAKVEAERQAKQTEAYVRQIDAYAKSGQYIDQVFVDESTGYRVGITKEGNPILLTNPTTGKPFIGITDGEKVASSMAMKAMAETQAKIAADPSKYANPAEEAKAVQEAMDQAYRFTLEQFNKNRTAKRDKEGNLILAPKE